MAAAHGIAQARQEGAYGQLFRTVFIIALQFLSTIAHNVAAAFAVHEMTEMASQQ